MKREWWTSGLILVIPVHPDLLLFEGVPRMAGSCQDGREAVVHAI
jgi:hypothetical protein